MKTQKRLFNFFDFKSKITNTITLCCISFVPLGGLNAQTQMYDDFEGTKAVKYMKTENLDTDVKNPASGMVNDSKKCAKFVRNSAKKYDYVKILIDGKLTDVNSFATYTGVPSKFTMKLYTNAPVGTLVEIQLGKQGKEDYPKGVHSQYQAYTTVSNAWEELQFKFAEMPKGSETTVTDINQITLVFNPNSSTSHTYYFDELKGPAITNNATDISSDIKAIPEYKH